MSEAEELRSEIGAILFDVNGILTQVVGLSTGIEQIGSRILALKTHNLDVASAGGNLINSIPEDLRIVINKLRLARTSLEHFREIP